MNETKLNLYKRFIHSAGGFDGYKQLIGEAPYKAVLFVLLLTFILGNAILIKPAIELNKSVSVIVKDFDEKVPDFEFKNGKLQISGNMPLILDGDGSTVIIDTSDSPNEAILDKYDNAMLIMKDSMVQKYYSNTRRTSFATLNSFYMNKNSVKLMLPLLSWLTALMLIFGVPFFIISKFVSALIISLIGISANSVTKAGLQYKDIFRISLYSMTLPLILCTVLDIFNIIPVIAFFLFYGVSGVYTWGAIKSISAAKPPME